MPIVVDAAVSVEWARLGADGYAAAVLAAVEREGLRVPEPWPTQVAEGLLRMTSAEGAVLVALLGRLTIEVEAAMSPVTAVREGLAAAQRYGVPAAVAGYLELAAREGLRLATQDSAMRLAAERAGRRGVLASTACLRTRLRRSLHPFAGPSHPLNA